MGEGKRWGHVGGRNDCNCSIVVVAMTLSIIVTMTLPRVVARNSIIVECVRHRLAWMLLTLSDVVERPDDP